MAGFASVFSKVAVGWFILVAQPAHAILGVDYETLMYYREKNLLKERFSEDKLKNFIKVRKETRPMQVHFFADDAGKIYREHWQANGQFWNLKQAHQIRQVIVAGYDSLIRQERNSLGLIYTYSKGGKVFYHMSGPHVMRIEAHTEAYDPGTLGKMPNNPKLTKPRLLRIE